MINVRFEEKGAERALTVSGHANYAEMGKDIVCSGVSAIALALASFVENYSERNSIQIEDGGGFVKIIAFNCDKGVDAAFRMALIGMLQIEMSFPKYVTVSHCKKNKKIFDLVGYKA